MATPLPFTFSERLPAILQRINPMIDVLNVQNAAIQNLETEVADLAGPTGPDLTLIFENGLV